MTKLHLLADLGGTNTRVALADQHGLRPDSIQSFRNADFPGLAPLLTAYLNTLHPGPVASLCAGVAGPVQGGRAQLTNYDWLIKVDDLRVATGAEDVRLINDLQAQGYALGDLPEMAVSKLFEGHPASVKAPSLVLNLGTGCNVAVVHHTQSGVFVPAAESGHTTLPHATGRMAELYAYLGRRHAHLPIEAALSGPGLVNIHEWISGAQLDPSQVIAAYEAGAADAAETLTLFTEILGNVAGNFALHHLPIGGLYLSGGLARAVAPHLAKLGFYAPFIARGPYTDIVSKIPVSVITEDSFALLGCARALRQQM